MKNKNKPALLVVDDDPGHRTTLRTVMKSWNYSINEAENGQKAVEMAKQAPFDLILMDIKMPKMNGYIATKKIKEKNPDIPVIAITAHALKGDKETSIEHGCDAYISKPINIENLLELIEQLLLNY